MHLAEGGNDLRMFRVYYKRLVQSYEGFALAPDTQFSQNEAISHETSEDVALQQVFRVFPT